ncbi:MAG: membrane integrity-associated transporter subunit PqiC [Myxococcales bacterium]|nr:membrane integrity-associated transporter subunit PqiC [Myxococcales bacterium]
MSPMIAMMLLLEVLVFTGCGGNKVPDTHYYQLAAPTKVDRGGELTLVLEALSTDQAYDDERIVYRTTPYRLDYYQYHRWSAAPGTMVGNYLEQSLERSGRFRAVTRELTADAPAMLGGRVVAIEEVDASKGSWAGRIVLELTLTETKTNRLLWTEQFEETEPLTRQTPEGLAQALSVALGRIADKAGPLIESAARTGQLNAVR